MLLALANVLGALGEFPLAIGHLEQLIGLATASAAAAAAPADGADGGADLTHLLSLLGRMHLQIGNLKAAELAYERLERSLPSPDDVVAVRLNRGLLGMARSAYSDALGHFEAALELDPKSALAANNAAVCQLYSCRLADAIGTLERLLRADPTGASHPTVISNLSNLYQMVEGGTAAQATLERLVVTLGSDDFDMGVLNLGQGMNHTLLKALVSAAAKERRGLMLGVLASVDKLTGVIAPLLSGAAYDTVGPAAPAWKPTWARRSGALAYRASEAIAARRNIVRLSA